MGPSGIPPPPAQHPFCYELASTGSGSVVFWCLLPDELREREAHQQRRQDRLRAQLKSTQSVRSAPAAATQHGTGPAFVRPQHHHHDHHHPLPPAHGSVNEAPGAGDAAPDTPAFWVVTGRAVVCPGTTASSSMDLLKERALGRASLNPVPAMSGLAPGLMGGPASVGDEGGVFGAATAIGAGGHMAGAPGKALRANRAGKGGAHRGAADSSPATAPRCTRTVFVPSTAIGATPVTALTATTDGRLLLWTCAPMAQWMPPASAAAAAPVGKGGADPSLLAASMSLSLASANGSLTALEALELANFPPLSVIVPSLTRRSCIKTVPIIKADSQGVVTAVTGGVSSNSDEAGADGEEKAPAPGVDGVAAAALAAATGVDGEGSATGATGDAAGGAEAGRAMGAVGTAGPANKGDQLLAEITLLSAKEPLNSLKITALLLTPCGRFLAIGFGDGAVRFYDLHLRLTAWYEELHAGAIEALSFVAGTGAPPLFAAHESSSSVLQFMRPGVSSMLGGASLSLMGPKAGLEAAMEMQMGFREIPNTLIATRESLLLQIRPPLFESANDEDRRGEVLLEGFDAPVVGVAPIAGSSLVALAVGSGLVHIWHTDTKQLLVVRELLKPAKPHFGSSLPTGKKSDRTQKPLHPTCIAADPLGRFLVVGTVEGFLFILNTTDLTDFQPPIPPPHYDEPAKASNHSRPQGAGAGAAAAAAAANVMNPFKMRATYAILKIAFSGDGLHIAIADSGRHTALYRFARSVSKRVMGASATRLEGSTRGARSFSPPKSPTRQQHQGPHEWELLEGSEATMEEVSTDEWLYIGRIQAHTQAVTQLAFSPVSPSAVETIEQRAKDGFADEYFWPAPRFFGAHSNDSEWTDAQRAVAVEDLIQQHESRHLCYLISMGLDGLFVAYDIGASSFNAGLVIPAGCRVRLGRNGSLPTAAVWYPAYSGAPLPSTEMSRQDAAACLVVAGTDFKLRTWRTPRHNSREQPLLCRKVVTGPTFGGRLTQFLPVAVASATSLVPDVRALAWATDDKVVGLTCLPLQGNPFSVIGVVAHAGPVTGLAVSADGRRMVSCGLDSHHTGRGTSAGSACIWNVDVAALEAQVAVSEVVNAPSKTDKRAYARSIDPSAPFLSMLKGGRNGQEWRSLRDFFAYAQVRCQGESMTGKRELGKTLPLSELPSILRAMGFFPRADDVATMMLEVRSAAAVAQAGGNFESADDAIDLAMLVRLYVNYRPVLAPGVAEIMKSLAVTARSEETAEFQGRDVPLKKLAVMPLKWGELAQALTSGADKLTPQELRACLVALSGSQGYGAKLQDDDVLTAGDFCTSILQMQAPEAVEEIFVEGE
jgi:hypothetical protein